MITIGKNPIKFQLKQCNASRMPGDSTTLPKRICERCAGKADTTSARPMTINHARVDEAMRNPVPGRDAG